MVQTQQEHIIRRREASCRSGQPNIPEIKISREQLIRITRNKDGTSEHETEELADNKGYAVGRDSNKVQIAITKLSEVKVDGHRQERLSDDLVSSYAMSFYL